MAATGIVRSAVVCTVLSVLYASALPAQQGPVRIYNTAKQKLMAGQ